MEVIPVRLVPRGFGSTERRDMWWSTPLAIFIGLSLFVGYATWAAFQNAYYTYGPYLSPFYAPELFGDSPHAWFGSKPAWIPAWVPFSPALPEENARMIAAMHGVVLVVDASPTIDSDWLIEGNNFYGQEIEMVIDGTTGAVERMEIED